jgi:hypothetical protein
MKRNQQCSFIISVINVKNVILNTQSMFLYNRKETEVSVLDKIESK